ncbi:MAG: DNA repair protein RecN [Clostridia bacterium]|nr:DNA repair protein RecN [Clostridia bacterium]
MLNRLYIKNIALISQADILFDNKLNILSGETGSGKSVILDSINFVLGSKADKSMIRYGETEATVKAEFSIDVESEAYKVLNELDVEPDETVIITRKFNIDGKGSIKINGNTVTASMLKKLTQRLVDVHGQSEHFVLLNEKNQLDVIDGLCGDLSKDIKNELSELLKSKREILEKIKTLGGDEQERERKLDLLNYQINEIDTADIKIGEFEELLQKRSKINNVEKILNALNAVSEVFNADGGCIDCISTAERYLNPISSLDDEYENVVERLQSLRAEAEDISQSISSFADDLSFDQEEAEYVEERLTLIKNLKRKYGADEEEILTFRDKAKEEYDFLLDSVNLLEKLNSKLNKIDDEIYSVCKKLTSIRKNRAEALCKNVENELKSLNIPNAKFTVEFDEYDKESANLKSANGSDVIKFMFSANKGEPLKPLNKVISGGEMSRFMLALKTQLKGLNGISTYIFDEIDAGISGYTAKTVAEKFVTIAKDTQIIAVSHLAQVCAASDSQFLIYKVEEDGKTITKVKRLTNEEKVDEIIRLTGNVKTEASIKSAKELISQFK